MGQIFNIVKRNHNGIEFTMYQAVEDRRAESATLEHKIHLVGKPSITQALNQYKYGDEIIIQVYNKPGTATKHERVNSNYDRIQIFFKRDVFIEICKQFLEDTKEGD